MKLSKSILGFVLLANVASAGSITQMVNVDYSEPIYGDVKVRVPFEVLVYKEYQVNMPCENVDTKVGGTVTGIYDANKTRESITLPVRKLEPKKLLRPCMDT